MAFNDYRKYHVRKYYKLTMRFHFGKLNGKVRRLGFCSRFEIAMD